MENSEHTQKVTFTVPSGLVEQFDDVVEEAHFNSRSAALGEAMRDLIVKMKKRSKR